MPFALYNAPATFQRVMTEAFREHLCKLIAIFLDGFVVFGSIEQHIDSLLGLL